MHFPDAGRPVFISRDAKLEAHENGEQGYGNDEFARHSEGGKLVTPITTLPQRPAAGEAGRVSGYHPGGVAGDGADRRSEVRLSLAKAFFAPGMLPGVDIGDFDATWPMIAAKVIAPVLRAAGFLVRPLALLMLVLTLLAQPLGVPQDEHLFWAAMFGWYVVQGAGPLSLDHILGKGLAHSPYL
jgi:uncharacterized membrane protein YphA (DoxX/SURF4 family)